MEARFFGRSHVRRRGKFSFDSPKGLDNVRVTSQGVCLGEGGGEGMFFLPMERG